MSRIRPEIKRLEPAAAGAWYCTVRDAMAWLGLSRARVRELIEQGRLGTLGQCWGRLLIEKRFVQRFERREAERRNGEPR